MNTGSISKINKNICDKLNKLLGIDGKRFLSFAGATMLLMSPYLNWISQKTEFDNKVYRQSSNIFQCGYTLDSKMLRILGVILFVLGVFLFLWELANFVSFIRAPRNFLRDIAYVEIFFAAAAIVVAIIAFFNKELMTSLDEMKQYIEAYGSKGYACHGAGPVCAILGSLLFGVANYLRRQL